MADIAIERVTKIYPDGTRAVDDLSLYIADGSLTVLVGPSGCGKTSLLRMIAGLEDISGGTIRIGDRVVNGVRPKDRDIAMVFQNYALYPHLTVYQNVAFGLRERKVKKREIDRQVRAVARTLALYELLDRKPGQLSGGQQQRVAMGRAIVRNPAAFLMDEPLSNLDAKLRVQMRTEISRIQRDLGATMAYVTHDQIEAMTMGDQVAVLRGGFLQQVAPPLTLYQRPANLFVAGFIGSPAMNIIEAELRDRNGSLYVAFAGYEVCVDPVLALRPEIRLHAGTRIGLGIRPEAMEDAKFVAEASESTTIDVVADLCEAMGPEVLIHFQIDAPPVLTEATKELAKDVDEDQLRELQDDASDRSSRLVARVTARSRAREKEPIRLFVDVESLHFFDLETGNTLSGPYAEATRAHSSRHSAESVPTMLPELASRVMTEHDIRAS